MKVPGPNYRSVSIPKDMYEGIERLIADYPELRYRSVAHYVEVAISTNPEYVELVKGEATKEKVKNFLPKVKPKKTD